MKRPVEFYSEGFKLRGDVYTPDDLSSGEQRAAVLLCHGYTGVKDLYLPDNAESLNRAGYVAMTFDYKGWGDSEGTRNRLAPYSRVMDVQAAMTFLGCQPEVDQERIGLYGTSYGGATVSWAGAGPRRSPRRTWCRCAWRRPVAPSRSRSSTRRIRPGSSPRRSTSTPRPFRRRAVPPLETSPAPGSPTGRPASRSCRRVSRRR